MKLLLATVLLFLLAASCAPRAPRQLAPPAGCEWAPLPLRAVVDPAAALHTPAIDAAVEAWTRALGTPAVVFVRLDADLVFTTGAAGGDVTTTVCVAGRARSVVQLGEGLDPVAAYYFAAHGLGHALGVGHATNEQSLMQATLDVGLMSGEPGPDAEPDRFYRVTENDAEVALSWRRWRPPKQP